MGGPMMGIALDSDATAVSAATNCIIAATEQDLKPRGIEMPCIRCGDCAHACPAGLLPQQLLRYSRLQDRAALSELGLGDCIECGCCDYVCPSQIPLTSHFVLAKDSL
jgi:electron transport complex protein RnfC